MYLVIILTDKFSNQLVPLYDVTYFYAFIIKLEHTIFEILLKIDVRFIETYWVVNLKVEPGDLANFLLPRLILAKNARCVQN